MARHVFTGFDSAWTRTNRGAIAHLVVEEGEVELGAPETASFDEALASINRVGAGADLHIIAIDQPLIVPNPTGSRPVEGVFRPLLGHLGGAIQPSNTGRIGMFDAEAPLWPFLRDLVADQDPLAIPGADAGRFAFECWPVAAQIAFASQSGQVQRLLKYNPGRSGTFSQADWVGLNLLMAESASELDLASIAAWFEASAAIQPRKADQDKVDAAICVLIASLWWRDGLAASAMIGDTTSGYIVTPISPSMAASLAPATASRSVPFQTSVPYDRSAPDLRPPRSLQPVAIRRATLEDAAAIARIYNQGIVDRVATLETVERSPEERGEWLAAKSDRHPVLVAITDDSDIGGWASLNQFNPRPAYDHVADISVYVDRGQRGKGVGEQLLVALEDLAREIGFHKLVLAAFPTNMPGLRLYQRRGFTTVGIYHEQGKLDDRWVDTIIMEKLLR